MNKLSLLSCFYASTTGFPRIWILPGSTVQLRGMYKFVIDSCISKDLMKRSCNGEFGK